jgi:hypothetical protein
MPIPSHLTRRSRKSHRKGIKTQPFAREQRLDACTPTQHSVHCTTFTAVARTAPHQLQSRSLTPYVRRHVHTCGRLKASTAFSALCRRYLAPTRATRFTSMIHRLSLGWFSNLSCVHYPGSRGAGLQPLKQQTANPPKRKKYKRTMHMRRSDCPVRRPRHRTAPHPACKPRRRPSAAKQPAV